MKKTKSAPLEKKSEGKYALAGEKGGKTEGGKIKETASTSSLCNISWLAQTGTEEPVVKDLSLLFNKVFRIRRFPNGTISSL